MADFTKLSDEELLKRYGKLPGSSKPKRNTPTGPGPVDTFVKDWGGKIGGSILEGLQMQHETEQKIYQGVKKDLTWKPDRVEQPSVRELQRNILTESRQGVAERKRREGLPVQEQQLERRNRDLNTVKNPNINTPGVATEVVPTVKQDDPTKPSKWKPKTRYSGGANKVQQLPGVKAAEVKALENTKDTTSTNVGAKDLAGKLGGDFGKAYKMIQSGKALWAMAKGAKAATAFGAGAGGAGMAALGPVGIAAAVGLAVLSKKGEKEGSPNLYRSANMEDPLAYV